MRESRAFAVPNVLNVGTTEGSPENQAMLALARRVGAEPVAFDGQSVLYTVEVSS